MSLGNFALSLKDTVAAFDRRRKAEELHDVNMKKIELQNIALAAQRKKADAVAGQINRQNQIKSKLDSGQQLTPGELAMGDEGVRFAVNRMDKKEEKKEKASAFNQVKSAFASGKFDPSAIQNQAGLQAATGLQVLESRLVDQTRKELDFKRKQQEMAQAQTVLANAASDPANVDFDSLTPNVREKVLQILQAQQNLKSGASEEAYKSKTRKMSLDERATSKVRSAIEFSQKMVSNAAKHKINLGESLINLMRTGDVGALLNNASTAKHFNKMSSNSGAPSRYEFFVDGSKNPDGSITVTNDEGVRTTFESIDDIRAAFPALDDSKIPMEERKEKTTQATRKVEDMLAAERAKLAKINDSEASTGPLAGIGQKTNDAKKKVIRERIVQLEKRIEAINGAKGPREGFISVNTEKETSFTDKDLVDQIGVKLPAVGRVFKKFSDDQKEVYTSIVTELYNRSKDGYIDKKKASIAARKVLKFDKEIIELSKTGKLADMIKRNASAEEILQQLVKIQRK